MSQNNPDDDRRTFMLRMKSSQNITNILQGDSQKCTHYIDQLDRFSRNFASHDKQQRQQERRKRMEVLEQRRRATLEREEQHNRQEDKYARKYFEEIDRSQKLHEARLKRTAHTNSQAINPITHQYDSSPSGSRLRLEDEQHRVKQLVRAHNLVTRGTSGFNLINGGELPPIGKLVPSDMRNQFREKLVQHYEKYRLKASSVLQQPQQTNQ